MNKNAIDTLKMVAENVLINPALMSVYKTTVSKILDDLDRDGLGAVLTTMPMSPELVAKHRDFYLLIKARIVPINLTFKEEIKLAKLLDLLEAS